MNLFTKKHIKIFLCFSEMNNIKNNETFLVESERIYGKAGRTTNVISVFLLNEKD